MPQDNITVFLVFIEHVAKDLARLFRILSQRCYTAESSDPVLIALTTSSPLDKINDVDMSFANSLYRSKYEDSE